jgi:LmbE family N-acetylglucosaminyl deacetylase
MNTKKRLLAVLAHPDDESLGNGGMLAKYAAEGVETYLVTATRGQRGWFGPPEEYPGPEELGRIREAELRAAAKVLGIREVTLLDYVDGELDKADQDIARDQIVEVIRRVRPNVIITFPPDGLYGHPDHMAISDLTTEAVKEAGKQSHAQLGQSYIGPALYYMAWTESAIELYEKAFGKIVMEVNGETRTPMPWPESMIDVHVNTSDYWPTALAAISCHRSQLPEYESLLRLPNDYHRRLWAHQTYVLANTSKSTRNNSDSLFDPTPAERGDADTSRDRLELSRAIS